MTYPDIPDSMTLQEYSLRRMLAEKAFDRIIIGASTMQDFHHQTHVMEVIGSEENPLEAIELLRVKESEESSDDDNKDDEIKKQ